MASKLPNMHSLIWRKTANIDPSQAIEALIAHANGDKRFYVITVPTPVEYAWLEHDCWPKIIKTV